MFFQLGEEIESVQWLQLVEIRFAELLQHFAIESGEKHLLIAVLVRHIGGARGERFAEFVLALLMPFQHFASAFDDAAGKSGEAGDFDAVALVGAAGLHVAKENNFAGRFLHGDVDVFDGRQKIGKLGQLVIVSGEKRARARVLLEMLDDGPGDGETVKRGGAASDFVEKHEARGRGVIQDGGDFAHFDEESGAPAGQIVAGADAREDAVGDGQLRLARGDERAHLRHEEDQRRLAQISGFASHVRAGDQQKLLATRLEAEIVRHKAFALLAKKLLYDGMAPANDEEFPGGAELRANVTAIRGKLGKCGENIELRHGGGSAAKPCGFCGHPGADIHEKLSFDFQNAFLGSQDFALVLYEFGRSEALRVHESLLALVVRGGEVQIRLRNLYVVPE